MKQSDKDLLNFLKVNKGWQWYSNDRLTKRLVHRLVNRNFCIKKEQKLDNGYIFKEVKRA